MTAADVEKLKPKLTIDEQIEHLKAKGVTFDRCTESEAAAYLADVNYYFHVASYRSLFEKRVGGDLDGTYVGLDFSDLMALTELDRELQNAILPITLATEEFAKTTIMEAVTARANEDGYSIVAEYWESLPDIERNHRMQEIDRLKRDEYSGSLANKYGDAVPLWVYLELMSFGTLINFYLFCSRRWISNDLRQTHYLLRFSKSLRNATAHGSCLLNGMLRQNTHYTTHIKVIEAMRNAEFSKRVIRKRMKSLRLQQIATTLVAYDRLSGGYTQTDKMKLNVKEFARHLIGMADYYQANMALGPLLRFLYDLFDRLLLRSV